MNSRGLCVSQWDRVSYEVWDAREERVVATCRSDGSWPWSVARVVGMYPLLSMYSAAFEADVEECVESAREARSINEHPKLRRQCR